MSGRRWNVEDVADMKGEEVQFAHVAKHLYNPSEQWQQVVPNLGDVRGRACEAGCVTAEFSVRYPDCHRVSEPCRRHVLDDHHEILAPAYRASLGDAETAGRLVKFEKRAWMFVGDTGVMVIVREVGRERRPEVKTAYRVLPWKNEGREPEDFFKAAVRKLRDKTSLNGGGL